MSSLASSPIIADLYYSCALVNGINFASTSTARCILLSICLQLSHIYRCDVSRLILLSYNSSCVGNCILSRMQAVSYTITIPKLLFIQIETVFF